MKWIWQNYTQIGFGEFAVRDHLSKFVKPNSKVICTFGGGSIDKNGARADVQNSLDLLQCEVRWEGGIPPNPEYDRLVEIAKVCKDFQPDVLLAVGGGSVCDGTKFISFAARLENVDDAWDMYINRKFPENPIPFGSVMTLPATGSEWDHSFVISKRSEKAKHDRVHRLAYPQFSLLDPRYAATLPQRQLSNGVFDAFCHCVDQYLTPQEVPMMDNFWLSLCKELVTIGPDVIKEGSSLELKGRLFVSASFALNGLFVLGKEDCWAIHTIGHQITAEFDVDHAATLSMVMPFLLENKFESRISLLAKTAEFVFGIYEGTEEEKARKCIVEIRKFIRDLKLPLKLSDWKTDDGKEIQVNEGTVELLTQKVMESMNGEPFGFRQSFNADDVRSILAHVIY
ncbi:alcohol dehydrogenase, iron-containing family protein [Tritrichomonas foetus]|uniref:Alcohol dehydrogenase, iron-containing family protein n=1 Tax=Tritrichomonas foetus TaxID=1144522 RepID=A0A1J4JS41_9EUKA|nr:alcohol dehydrogenase, iron-containing family protein [Tritrichomonas foetus]|eukprot:OHT01929.1 alcohol dehydrogenase, iron-containing family protein [Tritrichomonas foetus]